MAFADIRARLLQIPSYLATKNFLSLIGWRREGMGNVLAVKKTGEKLVCVVVGQVIDERLCCGPVGNNTKKTSFPKPLDAAKNTFMLGKPLDPDFAKDFDTAVHNIKNWEGSIAMTDDRRHFIEVVGWDTVLKFTAPCWELRENALKPPGENGDDAEEFNVDDETANWPVPDNVKDKFDVTKLTHRILPLPIYDSNNRFIDSKDANAKLRDAIIEVHFTVKHYSIKRSPAFDSFSGVVQQVSILKPAALQKPNRYRANLHGGPINIDSIMEDIGVREDRLDTQTKVPLQQPPAESVTVMLPAANEAGPSTHAQCIPEAFVTTLAGPSSVADAVGTNLAVPAPPLPLNIQEATHPQNESPAGLKRLLEKGEMPPPKRSRDKQAEHANA